MIKTMLNIFENFVKFLQSHTVCLSQWLWKRSYSDRGRRPEGGLPGVFQRQSRFGRHDTRVKVWRNRSSHPSLATSNTHLWFQPSNKNAAIANHKQNNADRSRRHCEVLSLTHSSDTTHLSDTSNISLISYPITAKSKIRHLVLLLNMLQVFSET